MSELRRKIVFSLLIHAMLIAYAIAITSRDVSYHVPANYMTVSLQSEVTGMTPAESRITTRDKNVMARIETPNQPLNQVQSQSEAISDELWSETQPLNEVHMLHNNTKDNENVIPRFNRGIHEDMDSRLRTAGMTEEKVFSHENNPPSPPITKRGQGGITKVGMGKFSGEISQNSGSDFGESNSNSIYTSIRDAIERAKIYPLLARKKKIEGTVITEFVINSSGFPENIKIRKSSGSDILDSAALDIIKRAAPMPHIEGHIVIPITFSLTNTMISQ